VTGLEVTPERLRAAREVVLRHAKLISEHVRLADAHGDQMVGLCGGDPISVEAQAAFAAKIAEFAIDPAKQFTSRLQNLADQLEATAAAYADLEAQNADALRGRSDPR
jgi:hypothetical protein